MYGVVGIYNVTGGGLAVEFGVEGKYPGYGLGFMGLNSVTGSVDVWVVLGLVLGLGGVWGQMVEFDDSLLLGLGLGV